MRKKNENVKDMEVNQEELMNQMRNNMPKNSARIEIIAIGGKDKTEILVNNDIKANAIVITDLLMGIEENNRKILKENPEVKSLYALKMTAELFKDLMKSKGEENE